MTKEKFLFSWVHNYFMTSIQITIAIESYSNSTITDFYDTITHELNLAMEQYKIVHQKCSETGTPEIQEDAILENYILNIREKKIKHFFNVLKTELVPKSVLLEYNVEEAYNAYVGRRSDNVFLDIIEDVRRKEEIIK